MSVPSSFVSPPPDGVDLPIRVIIVDDSLVMRSFLARTLESDPTFKVVATASNGKLAIDALQDHPAEVVILDIEMPVMDGLTAIPLLKKAEPSTQIIMASTLTQKNAEISLKAMSLGATDYLPKPSAREMAVPGAFQRDLRERVKVLAGIARRQGARTPSATPVSYAATVHEKKKAVLRPMPPLFSSEVLAIASSTGGPQALFELIKRLGPTLSQPIVITQHMPPTFTTLLADHIRKQCGVMCTEVREEEVLRPGHYYIAPGDFHFLVAQKSDTVVARLVKDPPENFCRPAADPMLRSLIDVYGGHILTVILTGMGQDGCKGAQAVVEAGGVVLAQDEATSVVWGMPGAVAMAGLCSEILPLGELTERTRQIAARGPTRVGL